MKNKLYLIIFILPVLVCVFSQPPPFPAEVDSLILHAIDLTFHSQFDSAMISFQQLVTLYPDHPVGYFYQTATLQSKMMDYETYIWEQDFFDLADRAFDVGQARLDSGDTNPWIHYYMGSVHVYKGLYKAKSGALVPGFVNAKKGFGCLKKAVELDSTLYDAYLGIGSYDYWSGKLYKYLKWLPWISDERKNGVRFIKQAMHLGKYSYWMGLNNLAWIEYDQKNYHNAIQHFQEGLKKYPGSRFFLWGLADTHYKNKTYEQAAAIYENLLDQIQNMPYNNGYNEILCRFKMVRAYYDIKNYEMCLHHCDAILKRRIPYEVRERLGDRFEKVHEYQKNALKKLKKKKEKQITLNI